jgi:hypothetical protein
MILDRALQRGLVTPGEVMEGHASSCPKTLGRRRRGALQGLACARPQIGIQFILRPRSNCSGIRAVTHNRKNCRTGSRHQRSAHFRLLAEPRFHLRKENKFLENRALEIVGKGDACKFLLTMVPA